MKSGIHESGMYMYFHQDQSYIVYVYAGVCDATYLSSCYIFVTELLTWESARSRCQSMGGHLATIDSQEEKNVIYRMVNSKF